MDFFSLCSDTLMKGRKLCSTLLLVFSQVVSADLVCTPPSYNPQKTILQKNILVVNQNNLLSFCLGNRLNVLHFNGWTQHSWMGEQWTKIPSWSAIRPILYEMAMAAFPVTHITNAGFVDLIHTNKWTENATAHSDRKDSESIPVDMIYDPLLPVHCWFRPEAAVQ